MNPTSRNPDPGASSRPKPRLAKLRKHAFSSNTPKSNLFPETGNFDSGFNPFRPTTDFSSHAKFSFTGAANEILDDIRELKIGNSDSCNVIDTSRVENDIRKLKIGESVPGIQNVSLFGQSVGSELPCKLEKLNIKDQLKMENTDFCNAIDSSRVENDIRKLRIGDSVFVDTSKNQNVSLFVELPNELKNLTVKDHQEPEITSTNHNANDVNSLFPPKDLTFQTPKVSNVCGSIFTGPVGEKLEFNARRERTNEARLKKRGGKLKKPVLIQDVFVSNVNISCQENQEDSFDSYSPMDISPCHESVIDNEEVEGLRNTTVELEEAFTESLSMTGNDEDRSEGLDIALQGLDMNEDAQFEEKKVESCQFRNTIDNYDSEAGSESFVTADLQFDNDSSEDTFVSAADTEVSSSSRTATEMLGSSCGPTPEDVGLTKTDFTFAAATSSIHSQSSTSSHHQKKKNRYRVSHDLHMPTPVRNIQQSSPSIQFFQPSESSLLSSPRWCQKGDLPTPFPRKADKAGAVKDLEIEQESSVIRTASLAAQEACDMWRLRGNQAYASGDILRAEDYYSQGVNCISQSENSQSCLRALMLCYSNRAAARMSLRRVREALEDCKSAAVIDPKFLRVQVRAANCYLALGDVENASQHFTACLQSRNDACVDAKLAIEASEGLEKSQRVLELMKQSAELMQQRNSNAAENALRVASEALTLSPYCEKLLELKAEALFMLGKYEKLIHLCEQTLASVKINHAAESAEDASNMQSLELQKDLHLRLWPWRLIIRSYFHLGRLEAVLDFLKKQEESVILRTTVASLPLVGTIRELLRDKGAGNEAFKSGNYVEAIKHYTAALSSTVDSRPFAAICFCNRAAAYQAIGLVVDAIADCSIAIALNGNYLKSITRRASLFEMIRDYDQATKDLQRAASLLAKHVEEKSGQFGPTDELNCSNELRRVQQWKYCLEEDAKQEITVNMYLILGVNPSVTAAEIKKAYRKAALRHHPDKACQSLVRSERIEDGLWKEVVEEVRKDAERLFKMIGEAYAILSDPIKRSRYDIDEEMRKAKKTGFGGQKVHIHKSTHKRESSRHQWQEVWRPYGNNFQSRRSETNYDEAGIS